MMPMTPTTRPATRKLHTINVTINKLTSASAGAAVRFARRDKNAASNARSAVSHSHCGAVDPVDRIHTSVYV